MTPRRTRCNARVLTDANARQLAALSQATRARPNCANAANAAQRAALMSQLDMSKPLSMPLSKSPSPIPLEPRRGCPRLVARGRCRLGSDAVGSIALEYVVLIGMVGLGSVLGAMGIGLALLESFDALRSALLAPVP
jgi:hypothetical protein